MRLKKNAPPRKIPLTSQTKGILNLIKEYYNKRGLNPTYVFEHNEKLANPNSLLKVWHRACDKCNIHRRSPHKSRKTNISEMITTGLTLNEVGQISGHTDTRTTLEHYSHTLETDQEIRMKLEQLTFY